MVAGILLLASVVFGLSVLFGKAKVENYYKFLIWLIFGPVLLAVGFNHVLWFWDGLPFWLQVISILLVPLLVVAVLRQLLPKAKWLSGLYEAVFQTLIYLITFPFRLIWRASRFAFQKERQSNRLDPYRPVVGGMPPLRDQHKGAEKT